MAKKPESRLQLRIRRALEDQYPGAFFFKVHGGPFQNAGLPDLIGVICGRFVGLEVKMPGGVATPLQLKTLKSIRDAGGIGSVVCSVAEALNAVRPIRLSA